MTELGIYGERLAESGLRVFTQAVEESRRNRQNFVSFGHILKALAAEDAEAFRDAVRGSKAGPLLTDELLEKVAAGGPDWRGGGVRVSAQVISLLRRAMRVARAQGREKVEAADLLSALAQQIAAEGDMIFLRVSTPHALVVRG